MQSENKVSFIVLKKKEKRKHFGQISFEDSCASVASECQWFYHHSDEICLKHGCSIHWSNVMFLIIHLGDGCSDDVLLQFISKVSNTY